MPAKNVLDTFVQFAYMTVPGAVAASGVALQQLVTGITNMQKVGWAVSRLEFYFNPQWMGEMTTPGDVISLGLTQSGSLTQNLGPGGMSMIDQVILACGAMTALALPYDYHQQPVIHDFGQNERLVLPQTLFMSLEWDVTGALTVPGAGLRVFYKEYELSEKDWYDLLQLRLPLGAA